MPLWVPDSRDLENGVYVLQRRDGQPSGWRLEQRPRPPRRNSWLMRLLIRIWGEP